MMELLTQSSGSVLARIVAQKVEDVRAREALLPEAELARQCRPTDRDFVRALRWQGEAPQGRPRLIAEIKRRSPSKGPLRADADAAAIAAIYDRYAAAISTVVDEPFFGGALAMIGEARANTSKPVLMKDFVVSTYQVYEARARGADAILLMASVLAPSSLPPLIALSRTFGMEPLVEAHDEDELETVLETDAKIIGINNRDLKTLAIDTGRVHRMAEKIPRARIIVAESGVSSREDVDRLAGVADAVLVGTTLMQARDIEAKLRELGW